MSVGLGPAVAGHLSRSSTRCTARATSPRRAIAAGWNVWFGYTVMMSYDRALITWPRAHDPEMSTATWGSPGGTRERAVTLTAMRAARSARVMAGAVAMRRYSSGIWSISIASR